MRKSICSLAILLFVATKSVAFEAWSFTSGMSKQESVSQAQSRGDLVDQNGDVTVIHRRDAATGAMDTYLLSFCDTGLSSVSKSVPFTPSNYADLQYPLVKQFGSPSVSVEAQSLKNPAGTWEWKAIKHVWSTPSDEIQLVMSVPTGSSAQLVPGITIVHSDKSKCGGT